MMGRLSSAIRLSDEKIKKGAWTEEEDKKLVEHIHKHGHGSWRALPKLAGLKRCGKSCRLRWTNYLRPDIKRGNFSEEEQHTIINLHALLGNKWSSIAGHLPGRTDNEIKNLWNTHLKKKLVKMGIDPLTHRPLITTHLNNLLLQPDQSSSTLIAAANFAIHLLLNNPIWDINNALRLINEYPPPPPSSSQQLIANNIQALLLPIAASTSTTPNMALDDQQQLLYDLTRNVNQYSTSLDGFGFSDDPQNNNNNIPSDDHHHDHLIYSHTNIINPNAQLTPSTYHYNHHQPPNISGSRITSTSINDHDDQLPHLVSASSDPSKLMINATTTCNDIDDDDDDDDDHHHHEKEISNKINISPNDCTISNPSSTSTTFDVWGWGGLIDGEATDSSYWKDIMDQACSQTWPFS